MKVINIHSQTSEYDVVGVVCLLHHDNNNHALLCVVDSKNPRGWANVVKRNIAHHPKVSFCNKETRYHR
jgi:hypothetical protein